MGPITSALRARLKARCARFAYASGGAAAIEFALMSIPFFLLLFGIIELAMIFLLSTTLDNATAEASRTIRTGELQGKGTPDPAAFKTTICETLGWLESDCKSNLYVDAQTFDSFQAIQAPPDTTNQAFDPSAFQFSPGGPGTIVVVRAYYKWPFITPLVSKAMQQYADGSMVLMSTASFRVEPYGS